MFKLNILGWISILLFAGIGFVIGTFKIPDIASFEFTKKVGGEVINIVSY